MGVVVDKNINNVNNNNELTVVEGGLTSSNFIGEIKISFAHCISQKQEEKKIKQTKRAWNVNRF